MIRKIMADYCENDMKHINTRTEGEKNCKTSVLQQVALTITNEHYRLEHVTQIATKARFKTRRDSETGIVRLPVNLHDVT
jgi:hypothetical protein